MKIQVIDTPRGRRFLWADKDHTGKPLELTAERLSAPNNCTSEKMEIHRKGELWITEGEVRWVGTHADCANFCNLGPLGQYRQQLEASEFEDGDEITISPMLDKKPVRNFERVYWSSMMVLDYAPSTKLYKEEKAV